MTLARPATRPRSRASSAPTTAAPPSTSRGVLLVVGLVAALVALVIAVPAFTGPVPRDIPGSGAFISARYDPPRSGVEVGLARGDGQLFATHAADPFLARPEMIRGGESEQAYRFQRPLYGWLGWAASGGQAGAVPWAVVLVTVASVVGLVVGAAWVLGRRGAEPRLALLLLLAPGVLADLQRVGPESLGTLLVLLGAVAWTSSRGDRRLLVSAVVCFATAGLCRETLLLVPATLVLVDLVRGDAATRRRAVVAGAASAAPYVLWVLVLHSVLGAWPEGSVEGRLSLVPFAGLVRSVGSWTGLDLIFVAATLATAGLALRRSQEIWLRAVVAAHLVFAATLGEPVWLSWRDWGRVLLPMTVFALVALARRRDEAVVARGASLSH